jgi:Choline/Carnitine o-acyltransferase
MEYREPTLINVNWWCAFKDHPKHPLDLLRHPPPDDILTAFQIERAAGLINNMLNYKAILDKYNQSILRAHSHLIF